MRFIDYDMSEKEKFDVIKLQSQKRFKKTKIHVLIEVKCSKSSSGKVSKSFQN